MTTAAKSCSDADFRNYDDCSPMVRENYTLARTHQTFDFVTAMEAKFATLDTRLNIWETLELLNDLVDVSDPDMDHPNLYHALQTAEELRKDNQPDWMQLIGLIHDLGKVMYLRGSESEGTGKKKQWAMVGDTFVVGCALPDTLIMPELNALHGDRENPRYASECGIYDEGCGMDAVHCSWGHDEYLYRILSSPKNPHTLPEAALYMVRFHSLYAYHKEAGYEKLMSAKDQRLLPQLKLFNSYDLYSKCDDLHDPAGLKPYYMGLVRKYFTNEYLYV